jgi:hypothetical protein
MKQMNIMAFQFNFLNSMKIHLAFHVSLLESYQTSTIPRRIHEPHQPFVVDGEQEYEVEEIVDS